MWSGHVWCTRETEVGLPEGLMCEHQPGSITSSARMDTTFCLSGELENSSAFTRSLWDQFSPPRKMPQNYYKFSLDWPSNPDFIANIALSKDVTPWFTEKEEQTQGWLPTFQDGQKCNSLTGRNLGDKWELLFWPKVKTCADCLGLLVWELAKVDLWTEVRTEPGGPADGKKGIVCANI